MACVVVFNQKPTVMRCTICNGEAPLPLPLQISQMTALIRDFERQHLMCRPKHPTYPAALNPGKP